MNKVIILGNVADKPNLKTLPNGTSVAEFSVATTERWTDAQGNKQESTEWHKITAWKKQAELCFDFLSKGSKVLVEGKIKTDSYEKDGQKRYITKINAQNVQFIKDKFQTGTENLQREVVNPFKKEHKPEPLFSDSEIPF